MKPEDDLKNQVRALIKWITSEGNGEIALQYNPFWNGDLQKYIDSDFYTVEILEYE